MCRKLIFILLDGLRADMAFAHMGWLQHLCESDQMLGLRVKSELPTLSRPLYEVLLTGQSVSTHGVTNNITTPISQSESLFHLVKKANGKTSAAAYHWISELYNHAPFLPQRDFFQDNPDAAIERGIFYWEDSYPDSHLFAAGHHLLKTYQPNFILLHPMGIDFAGHIHTAPSAAYTEAVIRIDTYLAHFIPQWRKMGYDILVTADHGMTSDGLHNGTSESERNVPLYLMSAQSAVGFYPSWQLQQTAIAPLACHLLGIAPAATMTTINHLSEPWGGNECSILINTP